MTIQLKLSGSKKDFRKLMIRLYQGKFDISANTNILVPVDSWDQKKQLCKDFELNLKIQKFKIHIAEKFNSDYMSGIIIDKEWLLIAIQEYFNRNVDEKNFVNPGHKIYFYDFSKWWLDNYSSKWKVSASEFMGEKLKDQYTKFLDKVLDYEKDNCRIKLLGTSNEFMYDFISYLKSLNYGSGTIKKQMDYLKFFCNRAIEHGFLVNKGFKQRIFIPEDEDTDGVFLNEQEVNRILKKDFSFDPQLEITKDNFIIAIFSGMRSSDFLTNLDISNFKEGYIQIITQKTKAKVVVPVHKQVDFVIKKYKGNLPPKQTNAEFNKYIKILCQLCDIDNELKGKVFDKKKKRKVFGVYKKYKLITAHSLRRSFCSNMRGKISDDSLSKIMGWSTDKLIALYDKNSKLSHANNLKNVWDNE